MKRFPMIFSCLVTKIPKNMNAFPFSFSFFLIDLQYCVSFWYTASDSYICVYIYIFLHILFHFSLIHNIEYSSLCYTVGPYYLFI